MPDQQRQQIEAHPPPPPPPPPTHASTTTTSSKSLLASMIRWLQIKKYQYEVTFSLYMLTSTEKFVFNAIILILFSLLIAAAVCYLPNHIAIVSNRLWYYVHGEFLYASAMGKDQPQQQVQQHVGQAARGVWEGVTSVFTAAASSGSGSVAAARESAEVVVRAGYGEL